MFSAVTSKVQRLGSMDSAEVMHRVRERWRMEADRLRSNTGVGPARDTEFHELLVRNRQSIKTYLAGDPSNRFYASTSMRRPESVPGFIIRRFPDWVERAVEDAGRLCAHQINILGHRRVFLGEDIEWNRDPITQYRWPSHFWADFDLIGSRRGDAKIIHELNRQQHTVRLAKAYCLTGDEIYAREAVAHMTGWIDQNPAWLGVNWQSSLDIALRAISWMWSIFLLHSSSAFDECGARRIVASLFQQLDRVYRYPSVYSSPNTHLIGEASALFMAGLLFPELGRAAKWREFGAATLVAEMEKQVSADGVYRESSTYYHCYAADFYVHTMALAKQNQYPFPQWMWLRLSRMLEYVLHMTQPDGSIPLIGDDDGGRVLALRAEDYSSYRDGLCAAAILFGSGDLKYGAGGFAEEAAWLFGTDGFDVFEALDSGPPAATSRSYAGCFIQRSGWDRLASHLVFDCGDLGMLSGGHGHADALSFTLFSGGQPFLIDPGTFVYNCSPQWRQFFRSTRAHNTVVVDAVDQSETAGTFSWRKRAATRVVAHKTIGDMEYVEGEHDGYLRLKQDVLHRRRMLFVRPDYWIVFDDFRCLGSHTFDFNLHFAPEMKLSLVGDENHGNIQCRANSKDAALQIFVYASDPIVVQAICGQTDPVQGWASGRYGHRQPCPVLSATFRAFGPASMITILAPNAEMASSRRLAVNGGNGAGNAIAASFKNGGFEDTVIFVPGGARTRVDDYATDGELFFTRLQDGALQKTVAINAKTLSFCDQTVFASDKLMPHVLVQGRENGIGIRTRRGQKDLCAGFRAS